ncbi:MAG TPA: AsmA family protein [Candidatus Omnitrophota bacterium]|nr:AsmA family protein [Candidatus Omnitrophota bacterium]
MKNPLRIFIVAVSVLAALAILAFTLIYFMLPLNKIKDYAAEYLSGQLRREVRIRSVTFNPFSGIRLKGLTISNRKGFDDRPFISADAIEMRYLFWPLLQGKVIIPELSLVHPQIIVEKSRRGDFNFSDMFLAPPSPRPAAPARKKKRGRFSTLPPAPPPQTQKPSSGKPPIDLIVNSFTIKHGDIVYVDYAAGTENRLKDLNVNISGITLSMVKPVSFRASTVATYQKKDIPVSLSGDLAVDLANNVLQVPNLQLAIAGDTLAIDLKISKGSDISASLSSDRFVLDPLIAIFASAPSAEKKEKSTAGTLTQSLRSTFSAIPSDLHIRASADLKNMSLSQMKFNALSLALELKKRSLSVDLTNFAAYNGSLSAKGMLDLPALSYNFGKIELKGLTATPFVNDVIDSFLPAMIDMKNKVEGKLDVALAVKGAGVEMPDAFNNLSASGLILLSDGMIKKIKSLQSIGDKYNLSLLKNDMLVRGLRAEVALSGKKLNVKKLSVQDTDLQVVFTGVLDLVAGEYGKGNRLTLRFSPASTRDLPKELSLFRDDQGYASADFELSGPLSKPVPMPLLDKPIEAAEGKLKVKIEAKKIEMETKAQQAVDENKQKLQEEATQKASQEAGQLKEDAKKKVKEIFNF